MMKKIIVLTCFLAALLVFCGSLFAQEDRKPDDRKNASQPQFNEKHQTEQSEHKTLTEEQILQSLDRAWEKGDNIMGSEYMSYHLSQISQQKIKTQRIADKIMAIPEYEQANREYPEYAFEVLCAKLNALIPYVEFKGVREFIIKNLNHESTKVQTSAARILLYWGDWELAAPVICRNEAYLVFLQVKDQRAKPLLEEAIINGSWLGKITAASALYYAFGDSTKYPQVVLDIILNAPINSDDENVNRAKYMALGQVSRFGLTEAIPGLIRLSRDTASGINSTAVAHLIDLSGMGYQEATQAINEIKNNHPDGAIRELAKNGLLQLEQQQK